MKKYILVVGSLGILFMHITACAPMAVVATGGVGKSLVEERSVGTIVNDVTIMAKIKSEFAQQDVAALLSKISVTVTEGRVLLTGSVTKHADVIKAVKIAWSINGVKEVINELNVGEKDIQIRASDSWIATKIKTKLLLQKGVLSVNYTVDANNGVVYLVGIAQNNEELHLVINIARKVSGVKEVISHVTLKHDPRRK